MPLAHRIGTLITHTAPIHCGAITETAQAAKMRQVFRLRHQRVGFTFSGIFMHNGCWYVWFTTKRETGSVITAAGLLRILT